MQMGVEEFTLLVILLSIVVGSNIAFSGGVRSNRRDRGTRH